MNRRIAFAPLTAAGVLLSLTMAVRAQNNEQGTTDPRILAYDKGPSKIDVSKYPKEMQDIYTKVFTPKCKKCHTLARVINCELVLPEEWERYLKRMMRKAGAFISAEQGKQIYEFMVYDSKTRKKAMYEKRLKESGGNSSLSR